jgi:hypothetical protein
MLPSHKGITVRQIWHPIHVVVLPIGVENITMAVLL